MLVRLRHLLQPDPELGFPVACPLAETLHRPSTARLASISLQMQGAN
jgi:hypothetical protein